MKGALFALLGLLSGCRDATAVMLRVTTDLSCDASMPVTTSISVGSALSYETRAPTAVTTACDPRTGTIGSLVLVPSGNDDEALAVQVITATLGKKPEECRADAKSCIVARRVLRFVPHATLELPVVMKGACLAVTCAPYETCASGRCQSNAVEVAGTTPPLSLDASGLSPP